MHLLAFLIVVWAVKHFVTHVQYAAKGMPPPRTQARLAAIEHGATGTSTGQFGTPGRERYGLRDLVADSWFDGCARVRGWQVARRQTDASAVDRSAAVDRIEAAPSRFGWFADSAKRVGRVLWEPVGEKRADVAPEVAATSGSEMPVRHTGHSAFGMGPDCPACRAQYGDPAAGTNPAAGSGVASDLAANQSEQKDTTMTTYDDLTPVQRNIHNKVLGYAGRDGTDCKDILDRITADTDDKAAVAEVLGGPGAGDEFRTTTTPDAAGQPDEQDPGYHNAAHLRRLADRCERGAQELQRAADDPAGVLAERGYHNQPGAQEWGARKAAAAAAARDYAAHLRIMADDPSYRAPAEQFAEAEKVATAAECDGILIDGSRLTESAIEHGWHDEVGKQALRDHQVADDAAVQGSGMFGHVAETINGVQQVPFWQLGGAPVAEVVADPQVNPPTSNGGTSMEASNYETAVAALDQLAAATRDLTDHVAGATAAANQFNDHIGEVDEARRQVADAIAAVTEQLAAKGVAASAVGQVQAAMEMVHAGDLNSAMDYMEAAKNALAGAQAAAAEASSGVAAAQDDLVATYGDAHATMAAHGTDGSFIDGSGAVASGSVVSDGDRSVPDGQIDALHGAGSAHDWQRNADLRHPVQPGEQRTGSYVGGGSTNYGVVQSGGGTVSVAGDVVGSQTVTTAGQ